MIQRPKVKWVAPIVLCGALIAGSSVAIAAATWSDSEGDASFDAIDAIFVRNVVQCF